MTNGWIDIKNTDMMLVMGGNPAENHPCGFKWVIEAKKTRNAKLIVVDPRFTRTAATSDLFLQIRAGADIAFLGGMLHYAIENNRIAKEYLANYTNAAFIVKEGFKLPEDGCTRASTLPRRLMTDLRGTTRRGMTPAGPRLLTPWQRPPHLRRERQRLCRECLQRCRMTLHCSTRDASFSC
jgi:anaerobic selenocysteine-containing dehydrogenase